VKTIPADELKCLLSVLYTNLEDKSAGVRNASEKAVLGFMMHLGYASMYGACEKLKVQLIKKLFISIKKNIFYICSLCQSNCVERNWTMKDQTYQLKSLKL